MMSSNFQEFVSIRDCLDKIGAFSVDENFDWAKSYVLPNMNLDLPVIEKRAKIHIIIHKKNPIHIKLGDGTKLYFTHDEFRRIKGEPRVGKTMVIKMLRLPHDSSLLPSQIKSCQII